MTEADARARATRAAIAHFACRDDLSETVILGFIHRETQRLLGEPVTALWTGWGRTRNYQPRPKMPAQLEQQLDRKRWTRR